MVSNKLLRELQAIIKKEFGREPDLEQVSDVGNTLVSFFELLTRIEYENENIAYE